MWKAQGWMAPTATLKTAMRHAIQDRRPTTWTSMDIREHLVTNRARTPGIAIAQPARKTRSDTSKVSWTKHEGMHEACPMTSENYWQEYETCPAH